jgi:hypothetical protein
VPLHLPKALLVFRLVLAVVKFLLPDRVADFVKLYEKPKSRKDISSENYVIEDCLQGLVITRGWEKEHVVGPEAAVPKFNQQLNIARSAQKRFVSSLFDIKQLVQADLFDNELDAARELNRNGFIRAAGAVAGVVLEAHLAQVCENHRLTFSKKNPGINDYNQFLKDNGVLETHDWRFVSRLGDLRNLCDHNKEIEPTKEQVGELIDGTAKVTKTIF